MTAIGAILNRNGEPLLEQNMKVFQGGLPAREAHNWWQDCNITIGGSDLADDRSVGNGLVVAADARLDNREELSRILKLQAHKVSCAQIIAAAYEKWGVSCPEKMIGDFSFVVWDHRNKRLFAARDCFGVRPCYYTITDKKLILSSNLKAIIGAGADPGFDRFYLGGFVAGYSGDERATLYQAIKKLPPGHSLTVDEQRHAVQRYWQLQPTNIVRDRTVVEQFRSLFEDAVACRIVNDPSPGVMLSGGLDSSSISVVAAKLLKNRIPRLPSFSMTFESVPDWSDGPHIRAIEKTGGFSPSHIQCEHLDLFADLDLMLEEQEGPFLAYNYFASRQIYRVAARVGIVGLLDGHGGDEVVSDGLGLLNELAQQGRWMALWREAKSVADIYRMSRWSIVSPYLSHIEGVRRLRRKMAAARRKLSKLRPTEHTPSDIDMVAESLIANEDFRSRLSAPPPNRRASLSEKDLHLATLSTPRQAYAFEVLDRAGAAAGVVPSYPFYDRRLVEFCVSLESHEKLHSGMTRATLREAMEGILPEQVRMRRDKFDFSRQFNAGVISHLPEIEDALFRARAGLEEYVNMEAAFKAVASLKGRRQPNPAAYRQIWRIFTLQRWLDGTKERRFHADVHDWQLAHNKITNN